MPRLLLVTIAFSVACTVGEPVDEGPPNLFGLVTNKGTSEPIPGVQVDALTSASPSRRRLMDESVTDEEGYYELSLEPRTYVIRVDVPDWDDCQDDLSEVELDVEHGEEYFLDFAFLPPPCP